jgi:hypothetical protein
MPDGLDVFKTACAEMRVPVMDLIVRTARWIDPAVVRVIRVWYPAFYRGMELFQADWATPQLNGQKKRCLETNYRANWTVDAAVGSKGSNWTCCHIWGYSDPTFQKKGSLTQNPRYYTCLPNLVLLPTPVKALTDSVPEVQQALRVCSWNLYGWTPDPRDAGEVELIRSGWVPDHYPSGWPTNGSSTVPPGFVEATSAILAQARRRKAAIVDELRRANAGELPMYPAERVRAIPLF